MLHRPIEFTIFHRLMTLEGAERAAFLTEACVDDRELYRVAASMLAQHQTGDDPILDVIGSSVDTLVREQSSRMPVQRLGVYRLIEEIGYGGMGTVYLGERDDRQFRQRVAVKLVNRGIVDNRILSRLKSERQILATLNHPNIARLLDGGTSEDGVPYLVMEYIEGEALLDFCDHRRLKVSERLRLFQKVCSAAHYAHRNLIVHRDLKPSNILVTDDGTPKLLDFGIAKLLDVGDSSHTMALTQANAVPMTPDYSSPEQIRGDTITTGSDVYALGVVLYELLCGERPLRINSKPPREMFRLICEQTPRAPSSRIGETTTSAVPGDLDMDVLSERQIAANRATTSDRLRRRLRGELDNIALTALRKEPDRRYVSAQQLADDIERHLTHQPVLAQPDTFSYRTSKFTQRHKVGVAATTALVVLSIAFGVSMWVQAGRIDEKRVTAEQVSATFFDLFNISDPDEARGKQITARELLDQGAERIRTELDQQPEVQATAQETIGKLYNALGLYEEAETLIRESLETRLELFGPHDAAVAGNLDSLGETRYRRGDLAEAEEYLRRAISINQEILGPNSEAVADSMQKLAALLLTAGRIDEAEQHFQRAMDIYSVNFGTEDSRVTWVMNDMARVLIRRADLEGAEALYRTALEIDLQQLGEDHSHIAYHKSGLAFVLHSQGQTDAAEQMYTESLGNYIR